MAISRRFAESNTERNRQTLFAEHLEDLNRAGLRVGASLAATLVPVFAILDYVVIPKHFSTILSMRLGLAVYACMCLILTRNPSKTKHVSFLSISLFTLIGISISIMIFLHTGYSSPYYAGHMLVVLCTGVLFRWRPIELIITYSSVYISYIAPAFIYGVGERATFVSNNFFLAATIIIVSAAQILNRQLVRREFDSNFALQRTKRSLEQAVSSLKEVDRLKNDFFSNVTHELRTPLTMILSPLDSLLDEEEGTVSPHIRSYLLPLHRNALKLLKLINNLLDVTRIEEEHLKLHIRQVDLATLLAEVIDHAKPLAARKKIEIELDVDPLADKIYADTDQMERVIVNLVSNALKFTNPNGKVIISLKKNEGGTAISVQDSGIGIPEKQLASIFERFNQGDSSVTRQYGGTGIGLALAKEIVELHGGRIQVRSVIGQGSTFSVHFRPGHSHLKSEYLAETAPHPEIAEQQNDGDPGSREWTQQLLRRPEFRFLDIDEATDRRLVRRSTETAKATKVLLVEDNVEVLRFLHLQLEQEHAVYLAQDGERGLELAQAERPDLIITDYMMPKMDGLTLIEALRDDSATSDIPIIMLSAKNEMQDRLQAREAGADIYLSKPFSPREIRTAVRKLLEKRGRQATIVMREHVKSLEVISAGLAHEIHNPLSYIKNAVFVIGEKVDTIIRILQTLPTVGDEKAIDTIERSKTQIVRMRDVAERGVERINQIVQLVRRYAREGYPSEPTTIHLDDTIRDVGRLISPRAEAEIDIVQDLSANEASVLCIPEELQQVIRNLWQNAMDAVGDHGTVTVRSRCQDGFAVFEIIDDGPGIAPDLLQRIFTPFFTTKDPGKGMGLGLAITHQVVGTAGGTIQVNSEVGKGTTFQVRLPIALAN